MRIGDKELNVWSKENIIIYVLKNWKKKIVPRAISTTSSSGRHLGSIGNGHSFTPFSPTATMKKSTEGIQHELSRSIILIFFRILYVNFNMLRTSTISFIMQEIILITIQIQQEEALADVSEDLSRSWVTYLYSLS